MPCPSQLFWFDHSNYTWRRGQAPHYAVSSNLPSFHPSSVQMFSPPCSKTPSVYVPPLMSIWLVVWTALCRMKARRLPV
jgi:hypothetical protein